MSTTSTEQPPVPDNDLLRYLKSRGTTRNFKTDPIPDAWIDALCAAGQRVPTSSNIQAYSIIVIKDPETKKKLAELGNNQQHIIDCPVFLAFVADLTHPAFASTMQDADFDGRTLESALLAAIDAALVGVTVSLAAGTMGLGSVLIGAMRNQPLEVAELLRLPKRAFVVFGLCVGWPKAPPHVKPRLPLAMVVHREFYHGEGYAEHVAQYDRELAVHYRAQQRVSPDAAWTKPIAEKFTKPQRPNLRRELNIMGFELE